MKHRTQILLEDWQYQSLQEMARKLGTTLSSLLRDWITEKIKKASPQNKKTLLRFAGKVKDEPRVAREHDRYLGVP